MAIDTTLFVAGPADLAKGIPAWLPPLAEPVTRSWRNPATDEVQSDESREPADRGPRVAHEERVHLLVEP